ncbi:hypothetical protein C0J52_01813 [Blattella germanica]|nr:hypothetical protein C0J52_01813 [Blattella germanica]
MSYLPEMVDDLCVKTTTTETATSTIIPYANVTVVIDTRWDYNNIKKLLYFLMQQLHVGEYGSTVTIIDGKTGAPFLKNAEYSIDIDTNFTESSYRTHESGMDIPKALEQHLKTSMQHLLNEERSKNMGGGRSTIVLFIPSETVNLNQNDLSIAQNQIKNFKDYLPVPIRLTNPNCGSDWNGNAYNRADFTYSVKQYGTNYHKLHANYFFSVGSAEIKIQGMSSNTLKVCHSRQNEYPNANSTNDAGSTCQQITQDTMTIPLTNPCDGFDRISQYCLYPHNVKYTISNTGLVCTAGVANNLGNSFLIITAATLLLILRNLCAGR